MATNTRVATTIAARYLPHGGAMDAFYLDGKLNGQREEHFADLTIDRTDRGSFYAIYASAHGKPNPADGEDGNRQILEKILHNIKQNHRQHIDMAINELAEGAVQVAGRLTISDTRQTQPYFAGILVKDGEMTSVTMSRGCTYLYRDEALFPLTETDYPLEPVDTYGNRLSNLNIYEAGVAGTIRYSNILQLRPDDCIVLCNVELMETIGQKRMLELMDQAEDQCDAAGLIMSDAVKKNPHTSFQLMIGFLEEVTPLDRVGRNTIAKGLNVRDTLGRGLNMKSGPVSLNKAPRTTGALSPTERAQIAAAVSGMQVAQGMVDTAVSRNDFKKIVEAEQNGTGSTHMQETEVMANKSTSMEYEPKEIAEEYTNVDTTELPTDSVHTSYVDTDYKEHIDTNNYAQTVLQADEKMEAIDKKIVEENPVVVDHVEEITDETEPFEVQVGTVEYEPLNKKIEKNTNELMDYQVDQSHVTNEWANIDLSKVNKAEIIEPSTGFNTASHVQSVEDSKDQAIDSTHQIEYEDKQKTVVDKEVVDVDQMVDENHASTDFNEPWSNHSSEILEKNEFETPFEALSSTDTYATTTSQDNPFETEDHSLEDNTPQWAKEVNGSPYFVEGPTLINEVAEPNFLSDQAYQPEEVLYDQSSDQTYGFNQINQGQGYPLQGGYKPNETWDFDSDREPTEAELYAAMSRRKRMNPNMEHPYQDSFIDDGFVFEQTNWDQMQDNYGVEKSSVSSTKQKKRQGDMTSASKGSTIVLLVLLAIVIILIAFIVLTIFKPKAGVDIGTIDSNKKVAVTKPTNLSNSATGSNPSVKKNIIGQVTTPSSKLVLKTKRSTPHTTPTETTKPTEKKTTTTTTKSNQGNSNTQAAPSNGSSNQVRTYTIKKGDNMWKIITSQYPKADPIKKMDEIAKLNGYNSPQEMNLFPGETIKLN